MPASYYVEILTYRVLNTENGREIIENRNRTVINRNNILYANEVDVSDTTNPERVGGMLFLLSMLDGTRILVSKQTFDETLFISGEERLQIETFTVTNREVVPNQSKFYLSRLTVQRAINTIRPIRIYGEDFYRVQLANRSQLMIRPADFNSIIDATPLD